MEPRRPRGGGGSNDYARGGDTSSSRSQRPCSAECHHSTSRKDYTAKVAADELNNGPRAQKMDTARGMRPSVLKELEPQARGAATLGYVAAGTLCLALPSLADRASETVDEAALAFLKSQAVVAQRTEGRLSGITWRRSSFFATSSSCVWVSPEE